MTIQQASKKYNLPLSLLEEYVCCALPPKAECPQTEQQCSAQELERLSLLLTLQEVGFDKMEVETYMRLLLAGDDTQGQRLDMLDQKRRLSLAQIHQKERQLEQLDYLRHKLRQARQDPLSKPCK